MPDDPLDGLSSSSEEEEPDHDSTNDSAEDAADSVSFDTDDLDTVAGESAKPVPATPREEKFIEESEHDDSQDAANDAVPSGADDLESETDTGEATAEESDSVDQSEIDARIVGESIDDSEGETVEPPDDSGALDQSAIDALLNGDAGEAAEKPPSDIPSDLSIGEEELRDVNERLNELAKEAHEKRSAPKETKVDEASKDAILDQSAIDALLDGDSQAPEPDAVPDDELLDQSAIDSLLDGNLTDISADAIADNAPVSDKGLDDVLAGGGQEDEMGGIDRSEIDALINGAAPSEPKPDPAASMEISQDEINELAEAQQEALQQAAGAADNDLPGDLLDSLVADAETVSEEVGSENVAAGAAADDETEISQDLIDELVGSATAVEEPDEIIIESREPAIEPAALEAVEELAAEPEPKPKRKPIKIDLGIAAFVQQHGFKLAASVLMGVTAGIGMYAVLALNPAQPLTVRQTRAISTVPLDQITSRARELNALGKYGESVELLDPVLESADRDPFLTDIEYLRIEAYYKGLSELASAEQILPLIDDTEDFVVLAPEDPRVGQVLYWQGKLYERQGSPYAARQVFERLLRSYANAPNRDQIMVEIARLSLDIGQNADAAGYLDRVLREFPQSPVAGKARLLSGDVERALGNRAKARQTYEQLAKAYPSSALSAEAYGRLGKMAYDEGKYGEAIELLEERRRLATTTEGNDSVFLVLAQSYKAEGQFDKAEEVLRELIDFFPESPVQPMAYIELSQVLDARGRREQAVALAQQAAQRFAEEPQVAENAGDLTARSGDTRAAAKYYETADAAGAGDAGILLKAGQQHMEAGKELLAADSFEKLLELYPGAPEAAEAGIALAQTKYERGETAEAVDRLTTLLAMTEGRPQRLPVLRALGEIYSDLGLRSDAADIFSELADLSREPTIMADCATALLEANRLEQAYALIDAIPFDSLDADTTYALLYADGRTRLRSDPESGIERMERAHNGYPSARTEEGVKELFDAYLATSRVPEAREMLSNLERAAEANPVRKRELRERALEWGDFHYDRGDYKTAIDGYDLVLNTDGPLGERDVHWARYQRANALIARGDTMQALEALDAIAEGQSPWADAARSRARYIRLDARMQGRRIAQAPGS